MRRQTLGSVMDALARVTQNGMCANDPQLVSKINEAQERLLDEVDGGWNKALYAFCSYCNTITLPAELESIEGLTVCQTPLRVENSWYEFIDSGPGIQSGCATGCLPKVLDRGNVVTFNDMSACAKIRVYIDVEEAAGLKILIKGFNEDGNKVMTQTQDGTWVEGEYIDLGKQENVSGNIVVDPTTPVDSINTFCSIYGVVKPATRGFVRIYQYDPDTGAQFPLAVYHPNETLPVYRRYLVPSIGCCDSTVPVCVTVLANRRFVPAYYTTDDLMITNIGALKNMLMALEAEESSLFPKAQVYENKAVDILRKELARYQGGARNRIRLHYETLSPVRNMR